MMFMGECHRPRQCQVSEFMNQSGFAKKSEVLKIAGPAGAIEVATSWPSELKHRCVMLVCHPHPLHLGTMNNKVVTTLCRSADKMGMPSVRFNFRGVGDSDGVFDHAVGEQADALAVIDWIKITLPGYQIVLAGFSFGSYVAASISHQLTDCCALISVAPPTHHYDFDALLPPPCPWLVLMGDQDEVVPLNEVVSWVKSRQSEMEYRQFVNCGHFFHGRLIELQNSVMDWVSQLGLT